MRRVSGCAIDDIDRACNGRVLWFRTDGPWVYVRGGYVLLRRWLSNQAGLSHAQLWLCHALMDTTERHVIVSVHIWMGRLAAGRLPRLHSAGGSITVPFHRPLACVLLAGGLREPRAARQRER